MASTKRLAVVGGLGGTVVLGAAVAALLIVQTKHANYVRETMAILPRAESEYSQGRFSDAAATAGHASRCLGAHPTWFEPGDASKIGEFETFLAEQQRLWKEAETHASTADPAKARAGLEALSIAVAKGAPRTKPLTERLQPLLLAALNKERGAAQSAAELRLPEAAKAYEEGRWDELLTHLEAVGKILEVLPAASREAATKNLEKDLKPLAAAEARVRRFQEIRDSKEDGFVRADQLRELIGTLDAPAGRDKRFRRELLKTIGTTDPEKRTPIAGLRLRTATHKSLVEAFTRGGDFEVLGDPADTSVIELQGPVHRFSIRLAGQSPPQAIVEADRVRVAFDFDAWHNHESDCLTVAAELSRALRAKRHERALAEEGWTLYGDAPGRCAVNVQDKKAWAWLDGRLMEGEASPEDGDQQRVMEFLAAARALEGAVRASASVPEEIKGPVLALLAAAHTRAPPNDYLDGEFCRSAIHAGYLDAQLPKIDDEVAGRLKNYRRLYGDLIRYGRRLQFTSPEKAVLTYGQNMEGRGRWRLHDPRANTTAFSSEPLDHMGAEVTVLSVFSGQHEEFPADVEPVEVRMLHPMTGVIARWAFSDPKLQVDPKVWTAALGTRDPKSRPEHFGSGDWQVPAHALKIDGRGQARELIVPAGSLKVGSFAAIPAGPERRKAQEAFLQRCSELLKTPGELHLFYRYFIQYVLDSPVTTATSLIGSSRHTGDVHQDALQTLDRRVNDRFLTDCDDLAELYWNLLRRQGRQAFVLGVPGHATCGVAEKDGDGWRFFCVDTGPPRQLVGPDFDAVVEKVLRTYDHEGGMQFDPRSMQFLFRFAGEQTRSDYYLDSRILRDPPYADLMIRVQEYWHFGFYALGIETMSKVLENDRMPANCAEISGLYSRIQRHDEALKWARAAMEGLDPKDHLSRVNEHIRIINSHREMKQKDEAAKVLASVTKDIAEILKSNPKEAGRLRWSRFQMSSAYAAIDRPWEGWALVRDDVKALVRAKAAPEQLMAGIIGLLSKMKEIQRTGAEPTSDQEDALEELDEVVGKYAASGLFKGDDSGTEHMRKYGQLYAWYAARMGPRKAVEELVKPEYPKEKRNHVARRADSEALDWAWIRVTPLSYLQAAGEALEKESKEAGGPKEAIAVIKALEAALPEIRRHGSLGTFEFLVMDLQLIRACLENDAAGMKAVFEEMKRQAWGRLYEDLSRTLGRMAAWMKLEDFEKAFRLFCEYQVPRRHYYGVVYAALGAEAREHALAASKICRERFPDDADMRREDESLRKLAQ